MTVSNLSTLVSKQVFDQLTGGRSRYQFRQWFKSFFYRLCIHDPMEDAIESEHIFDTVGLLAGLSLGAIFTAFSLWAIWYIIFCATDLKATSALILVI